jgi:hypothetical protein
VNYGTSGLSVGNYSATITIDASGASNTPQTIPVHLTVMAPKVPMPTFNPDGGTYKGGKTVVISCSESGAKIRYTTNGNTPTVSDPIISSGGLVSIPSSLTLKARAWKLGYGPSDVKTAFYTITKRPKIAAVVMNEQLKFRNRPVSNYTDQLVSNLRARGADVNKIDIDYETGQWKIDGKDETNNDLSEFINSLLTNILNGLSPESKFIFTYAGHGGFYKNPIGNQSDETPIDMNDYDSYDLFNWFPIRYCNNTSDEYLALIDSGISEFRDDDLAKILKNYPNISKTIILSSCYSGGFWGDANNLVDSDLSKISNIGLIAATHETEPLATIWGWSNGHAHNVAKAFEKSRGLRNFEDIADFINRNTKTDYRNAEGPFFVLCEPGIEVNEPLGTPMSVCSEGFNNVEVITPYAALHVPEYYPTIQSAINAASDGEKIIVEPNAYHESINFHGRNITLTSINPEDPNIVASTVIDGNGNGSVVTFNSGEDVNCILTGFTITNGNAAAAKGGGIYCERSSPTIQNCILRANYAYGYDAYYKSREYVNGETAKGGGIYLLDSNSTIANCIFANNCVGGGDGRYLSDEYLWSEQAGSGGNALGGAIFIESGHPNIISCVFKNNNLSGGSGGNNDSSYWYLRGGYGGDAVGGGIYALNSDVFVKNCIFSSNSAYGGYHGLFGGGGYDEILGGAFGGGIYAANGKLEVTNCTIVYNSLTTEYLWESLKSEGSAIYNNQCESVIKNSIIWGKDQYDDTIVESSSSLPQLRIIYSDVQDSFDQNNCVISTDPLFKDATNNDYHLLPGSPCIDAGDPNSEWSNEPWPNGGRIDLGAYGNTPEATRSRDGLIPAGFQIINKKRVGRTAFEYELALRIQNQNNYDVTNVQACLVNATNLVKSVTDNLVSFDIIGTGQIATSTDTFKIVVDRSQLIEPGHLTWELIYYAIAGQQGGQMMSVSLSLNDFEGKIAGDISGDGKVNFEDLKILAEQWLQSPGTPSADIAPISTDGIVNFLDFAVLAENWMK